MQRAPPTLSGWWPRVGATLLDGLIVTAMSLVLGVGIGVLVAGAMLGADAPGTLAGIIGAIAGLLIALIYPAALMGAPERTTARPGQAGARHPCRAPERRSDDLRARTAARARRKHTLGGVTLYLYTVLDSLWPLWDRRNQALHDKIASTQAVRSAS